MENMLLNIPYSKSIIILFILCHLKNFFRFKKIFFLYKLNNTKIYKYKMSAITITKWRIYCLTEDNWVINWSPTAPTTCVNNTAHTVNADSVQPLLTINNKDVNIVNEFKDTLQSPRTTQQYPIIDLKSFHGITTKNITATAGTGTVTATSQDTSEIKLTISDTTDAASIRSAKRGYYIAGEVSEIGVAVRIPTTLDTTQELKFGYYDDNNGYYYKLVGTVLNVCIMYNGVETLITRNNFNGAKLDGAESNGITLDFSKGNIFRIQFTWYGFGKVIFGVIQTDSTNDQKFYPMHIYNTSGSTSCANPYLPINVQFSSNGSTLTRDVYIAGRQYSIVGNLIHNDIRNMYCVDSATSTDTNINPLLTFRYKTNYKTCLTSIKKIRAMANTTTVLQLVKNATLTSANFVENTFVSETCLEVDTAATFTGGTVYKSYVLFANIISEIDIPECDIYEDDTITFTWKASSNSNTLSIHIEWDEKW